MLHPSYTDLMKVVNSEVGEGDTPVVNSRYSIVMATAKRARQIIAGEANVTSHEASKPLSTAVKELNEGKIKIMPEQPEDEEDDALKAVLREEAALMGDVSLPEEAEHEAAAAEE
ncbi:MAG: DNA-directed RNA polymerase subunit omega [Lachnospiraceae bacterium]|nr:DNA-directed RNA polymerase subunit omega [Lachnospiraceae bacterium]